MENDLVWIEQGVRTIIPNITLKNTPENYPRHTEGELRKLVASLQPLKDEIHQVRVTDIGDRLNYNCNASPYPDSLTTVKTHLNGKISMDGAQYFTLDIKYFYEWNPN